MRKIPTLFRRQQGTGTKRFLATPDLEDEDLRWVLQGVGVATEKWDGTACLVHSGKLYRRLRVRAGAPAPSGWVHWSEVPMIGAPGGHRRVVSGHGWAPVLDVPADRWHREAAGAARMLPDGTYELVGPAIQSNPYGLEKHELWRHGSRELVDLRVGIPFATSVEGAFAEIQDYLAAKPIEGIVWHAGDGRMAKVKRGDFALPWPCKEAS